MCKWGVLEVIFLLNTSVASEEGNSVRLPLKKEITAKFPVEKEKVFDIYELS